MRRAVLVVSICSLSFAIAPFTGALASTGGRSGVVSPTSPLANDTCSGSEASLGARAQSVGAPRTAGGSATAQTGPSAPGPTVAHPDFNGDGAADLAIAEACLDSQGGIQDAGAVFVVYGGANGLQVGDAPGAQFWTENTSGLLGGGAAAGDAFGHVMATGDFNHDGYDDLVVHSRRTLVINGQTFKQAGGINVIYGGPNGLTVNAGPGNQFFTLSGLNIPGQPSAKGDLFGRALAAGDYNGDGYQDLGIGIPQRSPSSLLRQSGAVVVLYGGLNGLDSSNGPGVQYWTQDSPGLQGQGASGGAEFGRALAPRDFNGDGYGDLAIGPRQETIVINGQSIKQAGAINVIYGSPNGLDVNAGPGSQFWTEDTPGLAGTGAKANDWWGRPIKAGDFNEDGYGDLAVGVFKKDIVAHGSTLVDAGAANIIYGGPNGLDVNGGPGNQFFTQNTLGIPGGPADGYDWWGRFTVTGDFNGDGFTDLELGEPAESVGSVAAAGQITIIYGGPNGLQTNAGPGAQYFNEATPGLIGGPPATKDWFSHGNAGAGDFNQDGYWDIAIGILYREVNGLTDAGASYVIYGGPNGLDVTAGPGNQYWTADTPGLGGPGAQAFASFGGTMAQAADGGSG